ncbi:hypothetical protein FRC09_010221 [Ceratobasidium sp. 395]|nr:hypothetical protein FRC09_010221 [Ceratobasidium sp. 395]
MVVQMRISTDQPPLGLRGVLIVLEIWLMNAGMNFDVQLATRYQKVKPPDFRRDAREAMARLTPLNFLELVTVVHEVATQPDTHKDYNNLSIPTSLLAEHSHGSQSHEAYRKVAELHPNMLKDLMSDVFHELGRRYSTFKKMERMSRLAVTSLPNPGTSVLEGIRSRACSQIVVSRNAVDGLGGTSMGDSKPEPDHQKADTISSKMSTTEVVSILTQHGCPDITGELDINKCTPIPVAGGGSGDVHQGHLKDGRKVAIKCARIFITEVEFSRPDLKVAARELHAWSKYNHPNIVCLFGLAQFQGRIAMISPSMENGTLRQYIIRFPEVDRCQLCCDIANGVAYLHSMGAVHGDIKGLNILISQTGTAQLTDFGSVRLKTSTLLFTGSQTVTAISIRWTDPELLNEGGGSSFPADVYALGVTILETITGKVPFSDIKTEPAVITRVVVQKKLLERPQPLIPSSSRQGDVLWKLLVRCWSYDPRDRPLATEVQNLVRASNAHHDPRAHLQVIDVGCTSGRIARDSSVE